MFGCGTRMFLLFVWLRDGERRIYSHHSPSIKQSLVGLGCQHLPPSSPSSTRQASIPYHPLPPLTLASSNPSHTRICPPHLRPWHALNRLMRLYIAGNDNRGKRHWGSWLASMLWVQRGDKSRQQMMPLKRCEGNILNLWFAGKWIIK